MNRQDRNHLSEPLARLPDDSDNSDEIMDAPSGTGHVSRIRFGSFVTLLICD